MSSYVIKQDGKNYCFLPGRIYKLIPYADWVEDINWDYVYYQVYNKIYNNEVTESELFYMDLEEILNLIDIRV